MYQNKYLKYKKKYLDLRKKAGGKITPIPITNTTITNTTIPITTNPITNTPTPISAVPTSLTIGQKIDFLNKEKLIELLIEIGNRIPTAIRGESNEELIKKLFEKLNDNQVGYFKNFLKETEKKRDKLAIFRKSVAEANINLGSLNSILIDIHNDIRERLQTYTP